MKKPPWKIAKANPDVTAFATGFGAPMPLTKENNAPEPKAAAMLKQPPLMSREQIKLF